MSKPVKKTVIRHYLPDGRPCKSDTPGAISKKCVTKKYYGSVIANGRRRYVPLTTHYQASCDLLKRLQIEQVEGRLDIEDKAKKHQNKTLPDLLEEWKADTVNGGASVDHAVLRVTRCRAVFAEAGWTTPREIDIPDTRAAIQRLRVSKRMSDQTHAHHVAALRQFGGWLASNNRTRRNPFEKLEAVTKVKQVRPRRELAAEELEVLLEAARTGPVRANLSGEQRTWLYLLAASTGLRASELASITPRSFTWSDRPVVSVDGDHTKNGRPATQPIPPVVAVPLRSWIDSLPKDRAIWPEPWAEHKRGGKMLKLDAAAGRSAWIAAATTDEERLRRESTSFLLPKDERGLVIDFHALRHTFISHLSRSGIAPKALMELARHATLDLTLGVYSHAGDEEKHQAVSKMWPALGCPNVAQRHSSETELGEVVYSRAVEDSKFNDVMQTLANTATRSISESCATEGEGFEPTDGQVRLRFSRPVQPSQKPQENKIDVAELFAWLANGCPPAPKPPSDPDLAELVSLWPALPEAVRSSVLVLVRAGIAASARPSEITPKKAVG